MEKSDFQKPDEDRNVGNAIAAIINAEKVPDPENLGINTEPKMKGCETFLKKMMAGIINITIDQIYDFRKTLTSENQEDFDKKVPLEEQKRIYFVFNLSSDEIRTIKDLANKDLSNDFLSKASTCINLLYLWTGEKRFLFLK